MKKMNIRKTMIAVLAAAMCATGAVIPTSADSQCTNGHSLVHLHGSSSTTTDSTYCYYTQYYQCVESCRNCSYSTMFNHTESKEHFKIYSNGPGGLVRKCADCGYIFS